MWLFCAAQFIGLLHIVASNAVQLLHFADKAKIFIEILTFSLNAKPSDLYENPHFRQIVAI